MRVGWLCCFLLATACAPGNHDGPDDGGDGTPTGGLPSGDTGPPDSAQTPTGDSAAPCARVGRSEEREPNDRVSEATKAGSGTPVAGTIEQRGDLDRYTLETCGEGMLTVTLSTAGRSEVDYAVEVFDPGQRRVLQLVDPDGSDAPTALAGQVYVPGAGEWIVGVADDGGDDVDTAPYTLELTVADAPDADVEPNDDPTQAVALSSGEPVQGYLAWLDDVDRYTLDASGEAILEVALTNAPATSSTVDFEVEVQAPDEVIGQVWDSNGANETTELSTFLYVPEAATYTLRVFDRFGGDWDATQPYTLTVTERAVPDAAQEPNENTGVGKDVVASAVPVTAGVPAEGYLASLGDSDVYRLAVAGETLVQVALDNAPATSSAVDYEVVAFAADAQSRLGQLGVDDGSAAPTSLRLVVYAAAAGDVLVEVRDRFGGDWDYDQPYTLTLTERSVPDAAFEPNATAVAGDRVDVATPVAAGTTEAWLASQGDEDCYVLTVAAEGALTATVATDGPSPVDYRVQVYEGTDPSPVAEGEDADGSDGPTSVEVTGEVAAGDVVVCVADVGGDDWDLEQGYALTIALL